VPRVQEDEPSFDFNLVNFAASKQRRRNIQISYRKPVVHCMKMVAVPLMLFAVSLASLVDSFPVSPVFTLLMR
jgi:hypothetical protein